jgi:hypothetical protein
MYGWWHSATSQIVHNSLDRYKKKKGNHTDIKWAFCKEKMDFMLATNKQNPGSDPTLLISKPP